MEPEPLILTVGRWRAYLDQLNRGIAARGRRVVGAASDAELRAALADPDVAAVVVGGAIPPEDRERYRAIVGALRPELPVFQHDLHDGEGAFAGLVDAAARSLAGGPRP